MGKNVKIFNVDNFRKVDTTKYIEGSFFNNGKSLGVLIGGSIKNVPTSTPNLRNYVKKDEVKKMIDEALKGVKENG